MGLTLRVTAALILTSLLAVSARAEVVSDIRNTKHNFSATIEPGLPDGSTRTVKASSESQICAFCHTPHKGEQQSRAPIWNRKLTGVTYTPYTTSSIDAIDLGQPNTKSKLCLSCHDGTLAIGAVNVLNRVEDPNVFVEGTRTDGTMPDGLGEQTGFTRRLGTDLTNDHPISFTYDTAQFNRDGELRDPNIESFMGERSPGHRPTLPLEDNQMECVTCHDPHVRSSEGDNIKFLRVNRFQQTAPVEGTFDQANDIICLACHEKAGWADSAHANPLVANEQYTDIAAEIREFPAGMQVWQAACFNCHDPHTTQGSRRLLREGTDDTGTLHTSASGSIMVKQGGKPAIEEVCYACHSTDGNTLQGQANKGVFEVPDIKTDFTTMRIHMPISNADQPAGNERHAIGSHSSPQSGKDFMESPQRLGKGDLSNRHAECTDCHNPHRVVKNRRFNDDPKAPADEGTHDHTIAQVGSRPEGVHTNLASGVLRGTFGIEPTAWSSTAFGAEPVAFDTKRGDAIVGGSTDVSAPYVTREYQICMKCHSNYAYDTPPPLGTNHSGGTPAGTNSLFNYTNQAMEYQSPDSHKGEGTPPMSEPGGAFVGSGNLSECGEVNIGTLNTAIEPSYDGFIRRSGYLDKQGNCVNYVEDNHRSWHPIMKETGRTAAPGGAGGVRLADQDAWTEPFNAGVGVQTMYCTDCHGSNTLQGTSVPEGPQPNGMVWGPHGSNNDFLLKGAWSDQTGQNTPADGLCFKCHNYDYYGREFPTGGIPANQTKASGFSRDAALGGGSCLYVPNVNLHTGHAQQSQVRNFRCTMCHVAIPHGWKNKNFLANLNDVGREVGLVDDGNQMRRKTTSRYYRGPYYNGAVLKVVQFRQSGKWIHNSCGSAGEPGNGLVGGNGNFGNIPWMTNLGGASEACNNLP